MEEKYIKGIVLNKKGATPIENAVVYQVGTDANGAETDKDGIFSLLYDENGDKEVSIEAFGFLPANRQLKKGVDSQILYSFRLIEDPNYIEAIQEIEEDYQENTPSNNNIPSTKKKATIQRKRQSTTKSKDEIIFNIIIVALIAAILLTVYLIYKYNKKDGPVTINIPDVIENIPNVENIVKVSTPKIVPPVVPVSPVVPNIEYR